MKYINTKYLLFDRICGRLDSTPEGISSLVDNHDSNNYGYVELNTAKKKMYFALQSRYDGTDSYVKGNVLSINLSASKVSFLLSPSEQLIYVKLGDKTLASFVYSPSAFFTKFYSEIDTENGKIVVGISNLKKEFDSPSIIGENFLSACIGAKYYTSSKKSVVKDIIISDEPIKMNETIKEIPISVASSDWNKDGDSYLTDSSGKKITFSADTSDLEAFNVRSASLFFESSQSSENINEIKTNIGGIEGNLILSDEGGLSNSNCVINPDLSKGISVES